METFGELWFDELGAWGLGHGAWGMERGGQKSGQWSVSVKGKVMMAKY